MKTLSSEFQTEYDTKAYRFNLTIKEIKLHVA